MNARLLRPGAAAGFAAVLLAAAGCGPAEVKLTAVKGTVTYKGKPVTGGTLVFVAAGGGATGGGQIRGDGTFSASGVPLGRVKVAVQTAAMKPAPPGSGGSGGAGGKYPSGGKDSGNKGGKVPDWIGKTGGPDAGPAPKYMEVPKQFESTDTSGIEVTVEEGKDLTIAFE